jgi:hypothetical protein
MLKEKGFARDFFLWSFHISFKFRLNNFLMKNYISKFGRLCHYKFVCSIETLNSDFEKLTRKGTLAISYVETAF